MSRLWNISEQEIIEQYGDTNEDCAAPLRFYAELFIEHSPATVWSYFSDLATWTLWSPICRGSRLTSQGELQQGSVLEIRFELLGFTLAVPARITQFDPPASITWQAERFGIRATHSYRFLPRDEGTLLCNEETFRGVLFPVSRLMSAWYSVSKLSSESLLGIKRELAGDYRTVD